MRVTINIDGCFSPLGLVKYRDNARLNDNGRWECSGEIEADASLVCCEIELAYSAGGSFGIIQPNVEIDGVPEADLFNRARKGML